MSNVILNEAKRSEESTSAPSQECTVVQCRGSFSRSKSRRFPMTKKRRDQDDRKMHLDVLTNQIKTLSKCEGVPDTVSRKLRNAEMFGKVNQRGARHLLAGA